MMLENSYQPYTTELWPSVPTFIIHGEKVELENDKIYLLDPETIVCGDRTGPCRIFMFSAAKELWDGTIEHKIAYMHATPASVSLEDPRVPQTLEEKRNQLLEYKRRIEEL